MITPEPDTIGGESIGRIGVTLGPAKMGPVAALVGGVKEVGNAISESIHQITRVFGPSGIGRVFTLLFTDAQRSTQDPTSVVGIGQAVGQTGSSGDWGAVLYFLAFVTVFIGLINLLPLPPFDGGHLAVLLIEKIRGKALDMRKLDPRLGRGDVVLRRVRLGDDPARPHETHRFLAVARTRPRSAPQVLHTAPGDRQHAADTMSA